MIGATRRAWQEWEAGRRNMPAAKWELFLIKTKGEKMLNKYNAINLMATTALGIEKFEIEDCPDASFEGCIEDFLSALRSMDDDEVRFYQVLPAGTDGEYEKIDAEYGIR